MRSLPVVEVVALGGTIAMTSAPGGGIAPRLDAAELVAAAPAIGDIARITATTGVTRPGAHLTLTDVARVAELVVDAVGRGAAGVVVTQGTDTLEETAYALDLMLGLMQPVVVTGALRDPSAAGADGPANLTSSVLVAASESARDRGVLAVLNEEIHGARYVAKSHTSRPDAFRSPGSGPVGAIAEGRIRWYGHGRQPVRTGIPDETGRDRVALVTTHLGDDGTVLRAVLAQKPSGLVIQALGAGHVPLKLAPLLAHAASSIPVVLTSRIGVGEVYRSTYAFPGSERDLLAAGVLWGGDLPGHKARILVALAQASGWSTEDIGLALAATNGDGR